MIRSRSKASPYPDRPFRWLIRVEKQEREEAESLLFESDSDAVQVMTIHKAKGLEFPVVFWPTWAPPAATATLADRSRRRFEIRLGATSSRQAIPPPWAGRSGGRRSACALCRGGHQGPGLPRYPRFYNPARPGFFWER